MVPCSIARIDIGHWPLRPEKRSFFSPPWLPPTRACMYNVLVIQRAGKFYIVTHSSEWGAGPIYFDSDIPAPELHVTCSPSIYLPGRSSPLPPPPRTSTVLSSFWPIPHSIAGHRQSFPFWTGASSVKDFNLAQVRTSSILQLVLRGDRFDLQRAFRRRQIRPDQTKCRN